MNSSSWHWVNDKERSQYWQNKAMQTEQLLSEIKIVLDEMESQKELLTVQRDTYRKALENIVSLRNKPGVGLTHCIVCAENALDGEG